MLKAVQDRIVRLPELWRIRYEGRCPENIAISLKIQPKGLLSVNVIFNSYRFIVAALQNECGHVVMNGLQPSLVGIDHHRSPMIWVHLRD